MAASIISTDSNSLKKVMPLLQAYCKAIHEITNQDVIVHRTVRNVIIHMFVGEEKVPVVFEPPIDRAQLPNSDKENLTQLQLVSIYTKRLRDFLFQYLSTENNLKITGNLPRIIKKLTKLKNAVCEFSEIIDKIVEYYHVAALGLTHHLKLPNLEELKEQKDKVCSLKSKLKVNELHSFFGESTNAFETSETHVLCAILGLEKYFADWYDELKPDIKMHQTLLYYLIRSLKDKEKRWNRANNYPDLYQCLKSFGFTEERATVIVGSIPSEIADKQLPSYWAEKYLENAFCYHPLINDVSRYPYCPDKKSEWFEQAISTDQREKPEEDSKSFNIKMINLNGSSNLNKVESFLKASDVADSELWYHGTTHDGAQSILTIGITLQEGKDGQDFSSGDGFYLSEKFENAQSWSQGGRGHQFQAIVVFKVPKFLLNVEAENGLDVRANKSKWEDIIRLCRSEYCHMSINRNMLDNVAFIKGPTCKNPFEVVKGQPGDGFDSTDCQICIRDEDYSVRFGSLKNVHCVIFF